MCPHCGTELDRPKRGKETWPCKKCHGVAIHADELHRLLSRFVDGHDTHELSPRVTAQVRVCPACNDRMSPATMVDVAVDRCAKDNLVWFDPQELEAAIHSVIAEQDARKGWMQKLRDLLFAN